MENGGTALSRERLIGELNQGIQLTRVLETHLDYASPVELQRLLVRSLLSTLARAVSIAMASPEFPPPPPPGSSPRPTDESRAGDVHGRASKKRKTPEPECTQWMRVSSAAGVEAPADDGFSWRKYGQKEILAAKFPRAYYRCSHHRTRGCPARKQVQRSDTDELLFDVVYHGFHSCGVQGQTAAAGAEGNNPQTGQRNEPLILNFRTGLATKPEEADGGDAELPPPPLFPHLSGHDDLLVSPQAPAAASGEPGGAASPSAVAGPSGSGQLGVDPDFPVLEMDFGEFFSAAMDLDFMAGDVDSKQSLSSAPRFFC